MASIFSKIVAGEIPCYKISESDDFLAFLDVNPLVAGHVLVIPKKETDFIFDLEEQELAKMMIFARPIAHAIKKTFQCKKVAVSAIGLEVPHAHIHLFPINEIGDTNFTRPKLQISEEELKSTAEKIIANL